MIKTSHLDQTLVVNPRGGGIAEYYVESDGVRHDIIYGYAKEEDADGCMGDVLCPFPGRVENSEYDFEGELYKLSGFEENKGNTLHAFVREMQWQVEEIENGRIKAEVAIAEGDLASQGYPFGLSISLIYSLTDDGLVIEVEAANIGSKPLPFGIGFHPYFKVATQVDEMVWKVPAKKVIEFDATLKPTGKMLDIGDTRLDFRVANSIDGIEIDNCFTELIRDEKTNRFTSFLSNLTGTKKIAVWQDKNFPYFQTYSSDTIADRNYREAMALEPQTCCGYAVNVEGLGLIKLKPGEEFKGEWGIRYQFKS